MRLATLCIASIALVFVFSPLAKADRLAFQRGNAVFLAGVDGKFSHKRIGLPSSDALWAISRDGRRLTWLKRASGGSDSGLLSRAAAIFVTDSAGRREKKLLATDGLKDRSEKRVTEVGPTRPEGGSTRLDDWTPLSLAFSADGRTIYLGIARTGNAEVELATVAVDASTGAAVVDADGHWKVLAPVAQADASDAFLTGVGAASTGETTEGAFAPLTVVRFDEESIAPLPSTAVSGGKKPAYGSAFLPSISPDARRIAFSSIPVGLWLADPQGKYIKRIVSTEATRPRWSTDGKILYFLAPRPSTGDRPCFDLYSLPAGALTAVPKKVIDDIEFFDIVPD